MTSGRPADADVACAGIMDRTGRAGAGLCLHYYSPYRLHMIRRYMRVLMLHQQKPCCSRQLSAYTITLATAVLTFWLMDNEKLPE